MTTPTLTDTSSTFADMIDVYAAKHAARGFSGVLPRLELTRASDLGWSSPCPSCGGPLRISNVARQFTIVCGGQTCRREDLAAALGVAAEDLVHLDDDVSHAPGGPLDSGPIIWDEVLAEEDVDRARLVLRYIRESGREIVKTPEAGWLLWHGTTWNAAGEAEVRAIAHEVADHLYDAAEGTFASARIMPRDAAKTMEAKAARLARSSRAMRRSSYLDAVLKELPALPGVKAALTDFDTNPDVLGVANGVVELRTGELRPYTKADRITRAVGMDFDPDASAPRWEKFLAEVFVGEDGAPDTDYAEFVARLIGYGVTGRASEHVLPVLYGRGGNGKGVFIETVQHVFGAHTETTRYETFEEKPTGGIPNDLAALRGARLVMASEGSAGKPMNEAVLKRVTGGDSISARFMRGEFFTFRPQFLILLATNYKPSFRGQDDGLWRRVKLLPFRAKFEGTARDGGLGDYLRESEAQGILAWAVRGASAWYAQGLAVPEVIAAETAAFRTESDRLGEFLGDTFDVTGDRLDVVTLTVAYDAYHAWAQDAHEERPIGRKAFGDMLGERPGITGDVRSKQKVLRGVKLLTPAQRTAFAREAERADRGLAAVHAGS